MPIYFMVIRFSRGSYDTERFVLGSTIEVFVVTSIFKSWLICEPITRREYEGEGYDDRPKELRCFHKSLYT